MDDSMLWKIVAGVLLFISCCRVYGNPVQPDGLWVDPCAGSTRHSGELVLDVPEPPFDLISKLELLGYQSQTASSICDEISDKIVTIIAASVAYEVNRLPPLDWFPPTHAHITRQPDIFAFLSNGLERLSRASVYLEYIARRSHGYSLQLTELVVKYRAVLCQIRQILRALDLEVTVGLTLDVIERTRRTIARYSHPHKVNYLIVRDIRKILQSVVHGVHEHMVARLL